MLPSMVFIDVVPHVTWLPVADEALLDWHRLLASRRVFLVDGDLPLVAHRLGVPFRGCPWRS